MNFKTVVNVKSDYLKGEKVFEIYTEVRILTAKNEENIARAFSEIIDKREKHLKAMYTLDNAFEIYFGRQNVFDEKIAKESIEITKELLEKHKKAVIERVETKTR